MGKVIVKTTELQTQIMYRRNVRSDYEVISDVEVRDLASVCAADPEIHAIMIDRELITPEQIRQIHETLRNNAFPIIVFTDAMDESETGEWLAAGAAEILERSMPLSLMNKRIGNVIQMYCMGRSLHDQARDPLTGMYNRHAFYHYAADMMREDPEAEYTIILSDIENFKLINARYGEKAGDGLLRYIGGVLNGFNGENFLFARYGGDRFVGLIKLLRPINGEDEIPLMQGIEKMYAEAPIERYEVKFGIYDHVDKSLPVSIMCDRAQMALQTVKHQYGRTLGKYTVALQQHFNREQQIIESMEQAITKEQFQVYYQPKHDTKTAKLIGVEALVRWIHPSYGFMSPSDFIPLFEENGFITKLDQYVLVRVCRDMKVWKDEGLPPVPVSINTSRKDLVREHFLSTVQQTIRELDMDPNLLQMEVTESVYMEDAEILEPVLREVREWGIRIELDDFGSGFSSLGILTKLPLDVIKLDISLIRNLETEPKIVKSIVRLMHSLGYRVIAEGVETDTQLELLQKMGCDWVQGYYFSKPLTFSGLKEYVRGLNS